MSYIVGVIATRQDGFVDVEWLGAGGNTFALPPSAVEAIGGILAAVVFPRRASLRCSSIEIFASIIHTIFSLPRRAGAPQSLRQGHTAITTTRAPLARSEKNSRRHGCG